MVNLLQVGFLIILCTLSLFLELRYCGAIAVIPVHILAMQVIPQVLPWSSRSLTQNQYTAAARNYIIHEIYLGGTSR